MPYECCKETVEVKQGEKKSMILGAKASKPEAIDKEIIIDILWIDTTGIEGMFRKNPRV